MLSLASVKALPSRINAHINDTSERMSVRGRHLRGAAQRRIWHTRVGMLERVESSVDAIPELPVLKLMTRTAGRIVHSVLENVTVVPVEDYDALNAKAAIKAVRSIDHVGDLLSVRRREEGTKARKTVLAAVEERLERLGREVPVPMAAVVT